MKIVTPPFTFRISSTTQNPYIKSGPIDPKVYDQYEKVCDEIHPYEYTPTHDDIPDFVFIANAGLSLPRLPEPVIILSNMKYKQRKNELPHLKKLFKSLHIKTILYPGKEPFEGQAECAWFHDYTTMLVGYGQRCTKTTVDTLRTLLNKIYTSYHVDPPTVIGIHIVSPLYYHLDIAMLSMNTYAIIQPNAFNDSLPIPSIPYPYHDNFALNCIKYENRLLTHKTDHLTKKFLEKNTGLKVKQFDVSEYEKSGGSIRCIVFDL